MTELPRHGNVWYDRLSSMQEGYFYPWQSTIGQGDGESAYLSLVREFLTPESDVLDAGCGHGELALDLAPLCHTIVGYDRVQRYIDLAELGCEKPSVGPGADGRGAPR